MIDFEIDNAFQVIVISKQLIANLCFDSRNNWFWNQLLFNLRQWKTKWINISIKVNIYIYIYIYIQFWHINYWSNWF